MLEVNFKIKDSGNIYGVQDSMIPYLIANLVKSDSVFYIAKNDIELSEIYNFFLSNFILTISPRPFIVL